MTEFAADDNFISTCAGVGGRWRRIVNINISAVVRCEWRKQHNLALLASVEWPVVVVRYAPLPVSLLMKQTTRGCVGELEDIRREIHWDFMVFAIID